MRHVMRYPEHLLVPAPRTAGTAGADDGCKGAWRLLAMPVTLHLHRLTAAAGFVFR